MDPAAHCQKQTETGSPSSSSWLSPTIGWRSHDSYDVKKFFHCSFLSYLHFDMAENPPHPILAPSTKTLSKVVRFFFFFKICVSFKLIYFSTFSTKINSMVNGNAASGREDEEKRTGLYPSQHHPISNFYLSAEMKHKHMQAC